MLTQVKWRVYKINVKNANVFVNYTKERGCFFFITVAADNKQLASSTIPNVRGSEILFFVIRKKYLFILYPFMIFL